MRICVVGCGAIGSLIAGHLARLDDVEVWGYDVSESLVAAIRTDGLRVSGKDGFTVSFEARTDASQIPPCDLGIVATKSEHTEAAIRATSAVFVDGAVASIQNGLGNEEVVARFVPRVIRGSTLLAGSIRAPAEVHLDAPGGTWFGPFEQKPARKEEYEYLADALSRAGLTATALPDARGPQWSKLIFNSSTNAVGALTNLTIGEIGTSVGLRPLVESLISEGRAVAEALGIDLADDPGAMIEEAVEVAFHHRASMLQDVTARRHTEVAFLNGGIEDAGQTAGVPTPLHSAMVSLITGLESSWHSAGHEGI